MKPRGGRSFSPGVASLIGSDILENRRLLSVSVDSLAKDGFAAIAPAPSEGQHASTDGSSSGEAATVAGALAGQFDPREVSETASSVEPGPEDPIMAVPSSPDYGAPDEPAVAVPGDPPDTQTAGVMGTTTGIGGGQPIAAAIAVVVPAGSLPSATNPLEAGPPDGASSRPAVVVTPIAEVGDEDGALLLDVGGGAAGATSLRWMAADDASESPAVPDEDTPALDDTDEPPSPRPMAADLITEFLPLDRAALDAAIDHFSAPLEELGTNLAGWAPRWDAVSGTTLVLATALAIEVARRRLRDGGEPDPSESPEDELARFPGHPSTWGLGES